jgi:RNA polymerase sigma-70 factor, ECF subfamily
MDARSEFSHGPDSGVTRARFSRRTTVNEPEGRDSIVARAVARAKEGDRDAIRFLYVRYADSVYGYVCSILRDDHEAEDLTQQVFAKLLTVLPRYEQRDVPFSAWILRVARNVTIDHLRRQRMIPAEEVRDSGNPDPDRQDRSDSLKEALAGLPPTQREVLVLRHVVGLSPAEIADQLGKSEGSIHGLHHRGRGALRQALTELEAAPSTACSERAS